MKRFKRTEENKTNNSVSEIDVYKRQGDIVGKYVSLFDWKFASLITDETVEEDIYSLEQDALERVMNSNPSETNFIESVMDCLIKSGVAIQLKGNLSLIHI